MHIDTTAYPYNFSLYCVSPWPSYSCYISWQKRQAAIDGKNCNLHGGYKISNVLGSESVL